MLNIPGAPRPRIARLGEEAPRPTPITCPLCGEGLGGILLDDPAMRLLQIEVECDVVDGGRGHRELHIKSLDLARKEDAPAIQA